MGDEAAERARGRSRPTKRGVGHHHLAAVFAVSMLVTVGCGSSSTTSPATTTAGAVASTDPANTSAVDPAITTTVAPAVDPPPSDPPPPDPSEQRNPGGIYGEYGIYERISFPAGSSGTTVSGGVAQGTVNGYLLRAAAGQRMAITLAGPGARFDAYGPADRLVAMGDAGGASVVVDPLTADGDYLIVVSSVRGGAAYDLTVEITTPAGSTASASCATYTEFAGDYPLRLCHRGDLVRDVQQALADLGYDIEVDGFFGPGTAAVTADYFDDGIPELMPPDLEVLLGGD